ncbi:F-box protein At3g07870-like [Salvia hispanica]|uniref:F-box protein At3g07870-like n=1 Tax=Salvia hispanica TaxID=49212 RepID=UPI002008F04C|nr:F-box protein At3g07870-like [Salvia hispanica]
MKKDLYLPQDIWRQILGRLPIESIPRCKYVCKSWRDSDMIEGKEGEFVTLYTPKPGMAFAHPKMGYAVCDEALRTLFRFGLPPPHDLYSTPDHHRIVIGSVNSLILVWDGLDASNHCLFILNPITHEYIELPTLPARRCVFGFGVSKLSGQYKIICGDESRFCHIYSLGRGEGLWRSIPASSTTKLPYCGVARPPYSVPYDYALFLNGNIHWLATNFENNLLVSCLDLETELFTCFSLPPCEGGEYMLGLYSGYQLCILEDRLCLCDNITNLFRVVIWMMENYGDTNSWVMEYTFDSPAKTISPIFFPLKILADGDLLYAFKDRLSIYSKNTRAFKPYGRLRHSGYSNLFNTVTFTPSFCSLKTMGIHNVQSLRFY